MTLPRTEEHELAGSVNGVTYRLFVSLPRNYDARTANRYPVVFTLDAHYAFAITRNVLDQMSDVGELDRAIVVGIAYGENTAFVRNRIRDYTPTRVARSPGVVDFSASGGGPAFLAFIRDDLIPFVDTTFAAGPRRTLIGHSLGGLFAAWVALTTHDLFDGYIIISPSLWFDNGLLFEEERRRANAGDGLTGRMYLEVGSLEDQGSVDMVADLRRFATTLEQRRYGSLGLDWTVRSGQTHNSVVAGAIASGLRFVIGRDSLRGLPPSANR